MCREPTWSSMRCGLLGSALPRNAPPWRSAHTRAALAPQPRTGGRCAEVTLCSIQRSWATSTLPFRFRPATYQFPMCLQHTLTMVVLLVRPATNKCVLQYTNMCAPIHMKIVCYNTQIMCAPIHKNSGCAPVSPNTHKTNCFFYILRAARGTRYADAGAPHRNARRRWEGIWGG